MYGSVQNLQLYSNLNFFSRQHSIETIIVFIYHKKLMLHVNNILVWSPVFPESKMPIVKTN